MNNEENQNTPPVVEPTPPTPAPVTPQTSGPESTPTLTPPSAAVNEAVPAPTPEPIQSASSSSIQNALGTSPQAGQDGIWVSKAEYEATKDAAEKQQMQQIVSTNKVRWFYRFLAITGVLIAILYIGMLAFPSSFEGRGECATSAFLGIAFWLNPIAYVLLLFTGILGTTTRRGPLIALGVLFIIAAPIAWFITGITILGPILCGV